MATVWTTTFWAVGVATVLFYLTVFPVWALIEAIGSSKLSGPWRVMWSGVIFFLWTLGALFYVGFGSQSRALKKAAWGVLFVPIFLVVGFLIMPKNYQYHRFVQWSRNGFGWNKQENIQMNLSTRQ